MGPVIITLLVLYVGAVVPGIVGKSMRTEGMRKGEVINSKSSNEQLGISLISNSESPVRPSPEPPSE